MGLVDHRHPKSAETIARNRASLSVMPGGANTLPKLEALTTLRFLAAFHVVLFHMRVTGILPGGPWWYQNFASLGYIGVNLFFVLSGFILVYTYSSAEARPRRFWQARFARIVVPFLLGVSSRFSAAAPARFAGSH